jgi:membrane AbrB-like protein
VHQAEIAFASETVPLIALLAAGAVLAYLVAPLRIPNSWLLTPVILGALVAALGYGPFAVPPLLLTLAQIVIGTWIGSRFRREIFGRLPRVTLSAVIVAAFLVATAMPAALALSAMTGLSFTTAVLAVAPAGITEMVITATAMHLDAATVTAFQLMRIAVVVTTIQASFAAYEWLTDRLSSG